MGIREAVSLKDQNLPSFDLRNALTTSRIALSSCVYCNFVKHTMFSLQSELNLIKEELRNLLIAVTIHIPMMQMRLSGHKGYAERVNRNHSNKVNQKARSASL